MWVKRNAGLVLMTICSIMCLDSANAVCDPVCGTNGLCDTDDVCLCTPSYYSSAPATPCDTLAVPADCNNGSTCVATEVCTTAVTCSSVLTPTCATLACTTDGAICMTETGGSAVRCHCDVGMTGALCAYATCAEDGDCGNGVCDVTDGVCLCTPDYYTVTNPCDTEGDPADCKAGQPCVLPEVCTSDATCSTDCTGKCQNQETCMTAGDGTDVRRCSCTADYKGDACELCATDDGCNLSNGTCTTSDGTCSCKAGYAGTFCEHACASECESCQLAEDGLSAECSGSLGIMASVTLVFLAVMRRLL